MIYEPDTFDPKGCFQYGDILPVMHDLVVVMGGMIFRPDMRGKYVSKENRLWSTMYGREEFDNGSYLDEDGKIERQIVLHSNQYNSVSEVVDAIDMLARNELLEPDVAMHNLLGWIPTEFLPAKTEELIEWIIREQNSMEHRYNDNGAISLEFDMLNGITVYLALKKNTDSTGALYNDIVSVFIYT